MSTPFVARAAQVSELSDGLRRAAAGDPAAVLLAADAGVGKSRLLRHVADLAAADGAHVVLAHCVDLGEIGLPYLPFAEALVQLRDLDPAAVDAVVERRPALRRLLPGAAPVDDLADDAASRLQLFDGVVEAVAAVGTAEHPLLLVLEDLHWADASSRDVLRFVVSRLRDQHVLLVGSYRTDDLHRRHPWRPIAAELVRHPRVQRMDLPPFDEAELREFVTAVAGGPLPEPTLRSVLDRSEGNAYFAEELVEAGADAALPWSLADVLRTRLEVLDPGVQVLARVASAAGRRVTEPLLRAAVAAHGEPALAAPGALDTALRDAVAHHVLVGDGAHIAFRHALLAEAVYADLLPGEQASLHHAYLRALRDDASLGTASQLAWHALRAPDLPTALTASRDAARQAHDLFAPVEELRHLEIVLRLWSAVPDAATALDEDHVDVLDAAATAAGRAGQLDRAVQLSRAAVEEAAGDGVREAEQRTCLARHLVNAERGREATGVARLAVEALPDASPARAWALSSLARAALNADEDDDAERAATEAVEVARKVGAVDAEADALTTLAVLVVDDPDRAAALLQEALLLARRAGDLSTELRTLYNLASNRYYTGDVAGAVTIGEEAVERARSSGMLWSTYGIELVMLGHLFRFVLGDLSPGPSQTDVPEALAPTARLMTLYAAVARGDADAVERGRAREAYWSRDGMIALIGGGCTVDALTWRGDLDEAVDLALRVIEHLGREWSDFFLGGIWLSALGLAALADAAAQERLLGRDVSARVALGDSLLERARTTADRGRPRGGVLGPEGRAWLERARAEHGRLVGTNDPDAWRSALREFGYGHRYELARTRWRLAESLLEHGDRDSARDEAATALAEADAMGAVPLATAVRGLARRGRLDLPGVRAVGADVLTAREVEVLGLVAQGLSNRQIGEKLFISGKTVSVHISNLLAKLGVSGRAEAVSVAHQRGLIGTDV